MLGLPLFSFTDVAIIYMIIHSNDLLLLNSIFNIDHFIKKRKYRNSMTSYIHSSFFRSLESLSSSTATAIVWSTYCTASIFLFAILLEIYPTLHFWRSGWSSSQSIVSRIASSSYCRTSSSTVHQCKKTIDPTFPLDFQKWWWAQLRPLFFAVSQWPGHQEWARRQFNMHFDNNCNDDGDG